MTQPANIFAGIARSLPEELFETIQSADGVRIERIVSHGHHSPEGSWYDQTMAEWVLLLHGSARLRFEDGPTFSLSPGDYLNIPAHQRHRVEWTDPNRQTIWLAIHYRA